MSWLTYYLLLFTCLVLYMNQNKTEALLLWSVCFFPKHLSEKTMPHVDYEEYRNRVSPSMAKFQCQIHCRFHAMLIKPNTCTVGTIFHQDQDLYSNLHLISSSELAQGELLGYRDVRRTCGRP